VAANLTRCTLNKKVLGFKRFGAWARVVDTLVKGAERPQGRNSPFVWLKIAGFDLLKRLDSLFLRSF
jgi:hypothetical protein